MFENNQLTEQEKDYILNILSNLDHPLNIKKNEAYNKDIIRSSPSSISNCISNIFIILKVLSVATINNRELSLQDYKNLVFHMKNQIIINQRSIKKSDINEIFMNLILILLKPHVEFVQYDSMVLIFLQLIKYILDNSNELIKDKAQIEKYFNTILLNINITNRTKEEFLILAKNSLLIYTYLFDTNIICEKIFIELIQKYIVPISDIIFSKTEIYIKPLVSYDNRFILVIKHMYDMHICCLKKMKKFFPSSKRREISDSLFLKYGRYSLDLIKLIPKFENDETNLNGILVFREGYKEFNSMKSSIFQFLCLILENMTYSANNINNNDFLNIFYQIIVLIQESFKHILENEIIFLNLRKIDDDEKSEEELYYNMLLHNMIYFLCKSIIKEPIKSEFNKNIQLFLLNIIFPLLVTIENEKKYMNHEPEQYCAYLNDLLYNLTLKNFRITGLILIKKICENFEDIPNFIFSYMIGMLDDLFNKNNNNQNNINNVNSEIDIKYNIYEYFKSQNIFLNKCEGETKLDLCLLIIIVLKDDLLKHNILKNRLREILIKNQNKFMQIKDTLIKIKLIHFFKFAIPNLFNIEAEQNKKNIDLNKDYINGKNKENISFIEIALKFLFNNLKMPDNDSENDEYLNSDALRNEISDIIIYLCKYTDEKNSILNQGINFFFQNEFHSLINLIDNIKLYSFFSVIEQIIKSVKITNRNDIFVCLEKLTKRFIEENEAGDRNSQLYCPLYFSIITSFFTGINKINIDDFKYAEEITKFNKIFKPILDFLNELNMFIYYENLIKSMINYIKCIQGINEQITNILLIIPDVIEKDRQFSEENFHYVSTFLTYFCYNPNNNENYQEKFFDIIIKILEKSFSLEFGRYDSSKLYSLLITLQLYNKNFDISNDISNILLINTVKCFNYIFTEDENYGYKKIKQEKNNVIFGIISLGYIFNPEKTYNILNEANIVVNKPKNIYDDYQYEKFNFSKYVEILNYINKYEIDNELLRKVLILGFCSIIKNENLRNILDKNKNDKIKFVIIFANFILKHKEAEIQKRNKIIKNELNYSEMKVNEDGKYNFNNTSNSDNEDEEEEEEEIVENKLNIDINYILEQNENIKNSDEYKFFKESLDYLRQTDIECINMINKELENDKLKQLENIYHTKKIKVNYQGKEFEIPRKILNIKKNI